MPAIQIASIPVECTLFMLKANFGDSGSPQWKLLNFLEGATAARWQNEHSYQCRADCQPIPFPALFNPETGEYTDLENNVLTITA
jgi:hypothetical protein